MKTKHNTVLKLHGVNNDAAVEIILDNLKPKTSYGWDGMSVKLMKAVKTALVKSLTLITNQSLKTGIFPDKLKIARVIPLFKKNDNSIFSNYSPISLLPAISEIFEKVVFIQLYSYFHVNRLFYNTGAPIDHLCKIYFMQKYFGKQEICKLERLLFVPAGFFHLGSFPILKQLYICTPEYVEGTGCIQGSTHLLILAITFVKILYITKWQGRP